MNPVRCDPIASRGKDCSPGMALRGSASGSIAASSLVHSAAPELCWGGKPCWGAGIPAPGQRARRHGEPCSGSGVCEHESDRKSSGAIHDTQCVGGRQLSPAWSVLPGQSCLVQCYLTPRTVTGGGARRQRWGENQHPPAPHLKPCGRYVRHVVLRRTPRAPRASRVGPAGGLVSRLRFL